MPCRLCWLASERSDRRSGSRCGVARKRRAITLHQDCPPWHPHDGQPGGGSHVRDRDRPAQGVAHRGGARRERSSSSVSCASPRIVGNATTCWRSRSGSSRGRGRSKRAGGLGSLLAQQLVAAGESVVDVPPTLSARVRLLDSGRTDKTDAHDARSAAIVALRHARLRAVRPVDHAAVLRMLANRHHDLVASRTRTICRLHALLCLLIPGGLSRRLSAERAGRALRGLRPVELVDVERKRMALDLLGDVRRARQSARGTRRSASPSPWSRRRPR